MTDLMHLAIALLNAKRLEGEFVQGNMNVLILHSFIIAIFPDYFELLENSPEFV